MIQRVVRNGRVRAFGAEWELDEQARRRLANGEVARIHASKVASLGDEVQIYHWDAEHRDLAFAGFATRRPVVDLMANLRGRLSGSDPLIIVIDNDHKGKRHSFSAAVRVEDFSGPDWHGGFHASGYGATEREARRNLAAALSEIINECERAEREAQSDLLRLPDNA